MVHKESSEGKKCKPRGRPFTSEYNPRKPKNDFLDTSGLETGNPREVIVTNKQSCKEGPSEEEIEVLKTNQEENTLVKSETPILPQQEIGGKIKENTHEIEFHNGENTLKISMTKKNNRVFSVKIFMNDDIEIRPSTYMGSTTAMAFWNLLKGALK